MLCCIPYGKSYEYRGLMVARGLSQRVPELKVLFVSGYSTADVGGWDPLRYRFLTKPFSSTELAKTIDDLLDS